MRFLSLFILCHFPFLVFAHPADLNQDQRISVAELASALALVSVPATKNSGLDDPHFAQAWFIWRSGETCSGNSQVPEPHNWLPAPTAGKSFLSLTKRVCLPLDTIEIIGLSNPTAALTARFQPR